ncbi:MAG: YggT family protein [Chlamydiales bacterium]|nr:YggT family protein [Chlamydiia bacterium]MCP5507473.1 YggT family protein [Chlamydiales bacterium]
MKSRSLKTATGWLFRLYQVYLIMILVRIAATWFPEFESSRFIQYLGIFTNPYLDLFRWIIPPIGQYNLSSIIALAVLAYVGILIKRFHKKIK